MTAPDERSAPPPARVLASLGIDPTQRLGYGGEAWVYGLDRDRVVRINRPGAAPAGVAARSALLSELGRSAHRVPFAIPAVLDTLDAEGLVVTVEPRLPGRPVVDLLGELAGKERTELIRAYLDAAACIGDLVVERPWFGDLIGPDPVRAGTYHDYLTRRAQRSLAMAESVFATVDPEALAAALPTPSAPAFVHLDAFPGNMLAASGRITAVLDFGVVSLLGDRRLDAWAAAAYLSPFLNPTATDDDRAIARAWLVERDLITHYDPARRWLAAFWSFGRDDRLLMRWCRSLLA